MGLYFRKYYYVLKYSHLSKEPIISIQLTFSYIHIFYHFLNH